MGAFEFYQRTKIQNWIPARTTFFDRHDSGPPNKKLRRATAIRCPKNRENQETDTNNVVKWRSSYTNFSIVSSRFQPALLTLIN